MTLLSRVKETAKQRGLSIEEVAKQASNSSQDIKISRSSLYQWDKHEPKTMAVKAVADVLGVSVDYLLGNSDEMHTQSNLVSDADLESAFDGAESFDGKPLTEQDKRIMKNLLISYMESKE